MFHIRRINTSEAYTMSAIIKRCTLLNIGTEKLVRKMLGEKCKKDIRSEWIRFELPPHKKPLGYVIHVGKNFWA